MTTADRRLLPDPAARPATWIVLIGGVCGLAAALLAARTFVGVMTAIMVPFAIMTSLRTKVLAYFVVLPLIGWVKYRFPTTSVQGVPDLVALTMLLQLAWELVIGRRRFPILHPYVLLVFGYMTIIVIMSQAPLVATRGVGIPGARVFLEPMILFLVGVIFLRDDPRNIRLFLRVGVVTAIIVGVFMLRQLIFGFTPTEIAFQFGRNNARLIGEQRLFSTLSGPAVFGFVTAMFTLHCMCAWVLGEWRRLAAIGAAISGIGILASGTRIALFGSLPAILLFLGMMAVEPAGRRFARRVLIGGAIGAVVLGLVVAATPVQERNAAFDADNAIESTVVKLAQLKAGTEDEDLAGRISRFKRFATFMGRKPLGSGAGLVSLITPEQIAVESGFRQPPNVPAYIRNETWIFQHDFYYFAVGAELGLAPLVLYIFLLALGAGLGFSAWQANRDPARRIFSALAASVVVLVMVHNLTNESFRTHQVAGYVWFFLAAPVALAVGSLRRWVPHSDTRQPPDADRDGERQPAIS